MANGIEVGKAYVQIMPYAEGISGSISSLLAPEATSAGTKAGKLLGGKLSSAASKGITAIGRTFTTVAATGASAISGITAGLTQTALSGGLSRAIGLDDATAKFRQLGMDVEGMMSSVQESVSGTRYGMDQMAGVAVNLGSAGVAAGADMTEALQSVASIASISGKDLTQIGSIYTKAAASGKVTGDVMAQLMDNGVNANAALQEALGKSSDEISAMVSAGEIDFQTFASAMKTYFGDAADSANSTFTGALANTKAALSRIGADFMSPVLSNLQQLFAGPDNNGLITAINNLHTAMQPIIDKTSEFINLIGERLTGAVVTFNEKFAETGSVLESAKAMLLDLIPDSLIEKFNNLSPATQSILEHLGKLTAIVGGGAAAWGTLTGAISMLAPGLGSLLGPLLGAIGPFGLLQTIGTKLIGVFQAMIPTITSTGGGIKGLTMSFKSIAGPIGWAVTAFTLMMTNSESFRNAIGNLVTSLGQALMPVLTMLGSTFAQITQIVGEVAGAVGDALAPTIEELTPIITDILGTVTEVIGGILDVLMPFITVIIQVVSKLVRTIGKIIGKIVGVFAEKWAPLKPQAVAIFDAIRNIVTKAITAIKKAFGKIKTIVSTAKETFDKVKAKITDPINKAKELVSKAIEKIKSFFPLKLGKIFSGIKLPHFDISGGKIPWGIGGKGEKPSIDVKWYQKAEDQPYMFDRATLFGAGERNDEILYGRNNLMQDIAAAVGGNGKTVNATYNISVDGTENPEEFAQRLVNRLKLEMRAV